MTELELLAPAKTIDIGIAAIDCGADAVYIAGPAFGARQAAGNSMEDIRRLCTYAHRFGVRIFITINTILYNDETEEAYRMMCQAQDAGVDAIIIQDLALLKMARERMGNLSSGICPDTTGDSNAPHGCMIPLHASTQCAIRDVSTALFYRKLGFSRLVLERELPIDTVRQISHAAGCEIEFFVHGALCVCYSGQCYLSEYLAGRSANRGECIQACRSLYDLVDRNGKAIVRNKALLSLKDYNLLNRIGELAEAGVTSFKIEGRLKNMSYVQNTTRAYSSAINTLISRYPDKYRRASFGQVTRGFTPDLDKTFNRGYTELFLHEQRGKWSCMDTPKGMGEKIGKILSVRQCGNGDTELTIDVHSSGKVALTNGDGFATVGMDNIIIGFRGDVCSGNTIRCRIPHRLQPGKPIWRNLSAAFERLLSSSPCKRMLSADVDITVSGGHTSGYRIVLSAITEDGRTALEEADAGGETATNQERIMGLFRVQTEKSSGDFIFHVHDISVRTDDGKIPIVSIAMINAMRRSLAEKLTEKPLIAKPLYNSMTSGEAMQTCVPDITGAVSHSAGCRQDDYKYNISNHISRELYKKEYGREMGSAYEISHCSYAELMRTKYCIRYELGICPKFHHVKDSGSLFLENNGRRLALRFDCEKCEMTVCAG